MHNLGVMEYQNLWSRCWVDFGTSDSLSIDILINALNEISNNYVKIDELIIGGENSDCLLYTSPSPRDRTRSRMPSSA